jgi:hypothetical protein
MGLRTSTIVAASLAVLGLRSSAPPDLDLHSLFPVPHANAARDGLTKEIEDLGRLRERLSLDLERVRLNKGIEELDQLRQTESEIAAYAKVLRDQDTTTEDVLQALGNMGTPPPMTMDSLMKEMPPAPKPDAAP